MNGIVGKCNSLEILRSNQDLSYIQEIMKKKQQDLIYVYDNKSHKIIMIDGETGEEVTKEDDQVTSILKHLYKKDKTALLRKFAVWCAHQINDELKPIQQKMLNLAEDAIYDDIENEALAELYRETEGTAVATDTVGLRQGLKSAPAYLAARECINPDVLEGAIQAARFHRLWAEMKEEKEEDEEKDDLFIKDISAKVTKKAIQDVQERQTNYLLDMMNK